MRVVVLRTYLIMNSPAEARPEYPEIPGLEMRPVEPADVEAYRETFQEIGREVLWLDRGSWQPAEWRDHLSSAHVRAWLARVEGIPAGLVELELKDDGSVLLTYMGAKPGYRGRGLGKYLISYLIERAWELTTTRVWGYTHSLDSEHALRNELKRGLRIWKRRARVVTVPDSLAPKVRELMESARSRGAYPGFLRRVEAHLRESAPGKLAGRTLFKLNRAARAFARTLRS